MLGHSDNVLTTFYIRALPVQNLIQGLVGILVALDPHHKILHGLLRLAVGVVRTTQLHLLFKQATTQTKVHHSQKPPNIS